MKKIVLMIAGLLCVSSGAWADRDSQRNVTVREAKTLHDDARVVLEGKITGRAGDDDRYWLRDKTGRIMIDVDDDDEGRLVGKQVRVVGNVDYNDDTVMIEVDHLSRLN